MVTKQNKQQTSTGEIYITYPKRSFCCNFQNQNKQNQRVYISSELRAYGPIFSFNQSKQYNNFSFQTN